MILMPNKRKKLGILALNQLKTELFFGEDERI